MYVYVHPYPPDRTTRHAQPHVHPSTKRNHTPPNANANRPAVPLKDWKASKTRALFSKNGPLDHHQQILRFAINMYHQAAPRTPSASATCVRRACMASRLRGRKRNLAQREARGSMMRVT